MNYTRVTTWFLAASMFLFGILKFIDPFKGWYAVQIATSGLGEISYAMGIMGEVGVGMLLFICLVYEERMGKRIYALLSTISFLTIIIIMLTGVYVHLNPNVPADVLPLKIKPPYIPVFFLIVALSNVVLSIYSMAKPSTKAYKIF